MNWRFAKDAPSTWAKPHYFTDPDSRIMKNSTNKDVDQYYNPEVTVDQESFLVVANTLSSHPNDQGEAIPSG